MKNSNDTIGNRTRNLLACSAVPQPTVVYSGTVNKTYVVENDYDNTTATTPHYGPEIDSATNRIKYQEYFLGVKVACA